MVKFRIPKQSGTHSEILAAAGLATLAPGVASKIVDRQTEFEVELQSDFTAELQHALDYTPGYQYLKPNANARVPQEVTGVLDYAAMKERADRYRAALRQARQGGGEVAELVQQDRPPDDWQLYRALNALQGDDGTNKAALAIIRGRDTWPDQLWTSLQELARGGRPSASWKTNLVQLFSPHAAKGYARLKPDSTDRNDSGKNAWGEPFTEWLKYRGYFQAACPFFIGDNVRLLTPVPNSIDARLYTEVVRRLRKEVIFGAAPKIDCLAILRLASILISESKEFLGVHQNPRDLVSSVMITHYQSMGQSKAVTGVETLALPNWFDLRDEDRARLWFNTLEEHFSVIRSLRDDYSDQLGLILQYRRFLEVRGTTATFALVSFLEQYGIFLMRERGRDPKSRRRQFRADHIKEILMQYSNYAEILNNPGFQALAGAIRNATVTAQTLKALNKKDYRDIRYDLLPELRRKRSLPGTQPFLEAITDFVSVYNAENARRLELGKTASRRVTTEEIESFVGLLSQHKDASVIGAMLCAYATCRKPAEPEAPSGAEQLTQEEETQDVEY